MTVALKSPPRHVWPKQFPPLTTEQERVSNDFMRHWHEVLPRKYGAVERFNHIYPVMFAPPSPGSRTLEIGAGLGEHLEYEDLTQQEYHCVELRANMAAAIGKRFPSVQATVADCQTLLPYPADHFDRVLAIHVLEHLPNLPAALDEVMRVLKPGGKFAVVLPCDPGLAYEVARKISAERIFRKRYRQPYKWLIRREHINSPSEIQQQVMLRLPITHRRFWPLIVPVPVFNLCIGLIAVKPEIVLKRRG